MYCERCSKLAEFLGPSYYCRERHLIWLCTECDHITMTRGWKQILRDYWDMMRGIPLRGSYMEKCKRIRSDGPTPCWCCVGECWGDKLDKENA